MVMTKHFIELPLKVIFPISGLRGRSFLFTAQDQSKLALIMLCFPNDAALIVRYSVRESAKKFTFQIHLHRAKQLRCFQFL